MISDINDPENFNKVYQAVNAYTIASPIDAKLEITGIEYFDKDNNAIATISNDLKNDINVEFELKIFNVPYIDNTIQVQSMDTIVDMVTSQTAETEEIFASLTEISSMIG